MNGHAAIVAEAMGISEAEAESMLTQTLFDVEKSLNHKSVFCIISVVAFLMARVIDDSSDSELGKTKLSEMFTYMFYDALKFIGGHEEETLQ